MHAPGVTLASEWLNVAAAAAKPNVFTIPTLRDFRERYAVDGSQCALIEEVRRDRFRPIHRSLSPVGARSNYQAPLPGFLHSPHDMLLLEEFSRLLRQPCGAKLVTHYCQNGKPFKSLAYTALPLLDDQFKARYIVLQASEIRQSRRSLRFAAETKPDRLVGGAPCSLNPNGFEYQIEEYLDLGWGTPDICCDATPCVRGCD